MQNELLYFLLPGCPHCRLASKLIDELMEERPEYRNIRIRRVDESREVEFANAHDYYLVPCFYLNGKKLHEGHAEREDVERVLARAAGL